jgi:hypothetical protein
MEWSKSPEKIASAAGVDDSLTQCFTVFERLHGHEKTTAYTFEPGRNHGHIPTPDGERDIHGASGDYPQDAVKDGLPDDFGVVAVAARVRGGAIHRRGSKQPAIMDGREMLRVKGMRRIHVPIAIGHVAKSFSGGKIRGIGAENERQGKEGLGAVEEKDRAVALSDRIRSKPGKRRNLCRMRDGGADAVCSIAPIVKGTLKRFSNDGAAAEVCTQVSAARIHHRD